MNAPFWLNPDDVVFPSPDLALKEPNGLLAIGGDLSKERLLAAYSEGIFPWYSEGDPILWWSPDPRAILFLEDFKVSRSLNKMIKQHRYSVHFDRNFKRVIEACQKPRPKAGLGTWITKDMLNAYCTLFEQGFAHCVEIQQDGVIWGGLYGVSLDQAFFGESMFSLKPNGSKIALYHLVEKIKGWNFKWIDCQVPSSHLDKLGAKQLPRSEFLAMLKSALKAESHIGSWQST